MGWKVENKLVVVHVCCKWVILNLVWPDHYFRAGVLSLSV